jgi:hypothetical protein
MKIQTITALMFSALMAVPAMANECTQTCEEDYKACKEVAESGTAKQACEDDIQSCKADCN